jgi:hypothetical protein
MHTQPFNAREKKKRLKCPPTLRLLFHAFQTLASKGSQRGLQKVAPLWSP